MTATLTTTALATTPDHAVPFVASGPLRRVAAVVLDVLTMVGVGLSIPFVILAIGIPFALCLRLLLWMFGMV
jgi:hypothetical protein